MAACMLTSQLQPLLAVLALQVVRTMQKHAVHRMRASNGHMLLMDSPLLVSPADGLAFAGGGGWQLQHSTELG